jgi:signal transduction histidine kinase/CheY-like chemotaxis protein
MIRELARLEVRDQADVFAARQLGRSVAAELGLERQDQVRVATALSEVSRSVVQAGELATIVFGFDASSLLVTITVDAALLDEGLQAAGRLMDKIKVSGNVVTLARRRPAGPPPDAAVISSRLAALFPAPALEELRRQNQDLITALDDLKQQKEQLLLLNTELEETNSGVMALYGQLSDELEQTNRGVVALYAELDEKSERLRAASESKNRFWANISHELRTPLNSIIGLSRLLADSPEELSTEQAYQVDLIRNSGTALLALVNDLLDVAKAESGRLQADPARVNLRALLGRLRALVRPMADVGSVSIVVDDEGAPETILTDELALTAILRNLLSNGIKYADGGEVRLTAVTAGSEVVITVADTGIGIPAGLHAHVFEEFYQVPGVRRGGTGLGLPYARRLAHLIGGQLTLASEPGQGTTVTLRLPHGPARVGTVLIADDDAGFRAVLRSMLSMIATDIVEVPDGQQALAVLAERHVDLLLADMLMPGLDGRQLLAGVPEQVPAIVITAMDIETPARAAGLLRKDELSQDRLAFAIRRAAREVR